MRFFANDREIGSIAVKKISSCSAVGVLQAELGEWRLRPRALTLTLWARLLLADVFIHGIGGAKYDRITDTIIADYYHLTPPAMACVSATLHLGLPHRSMTTDGIQDLRQSVRDLHHNPQRHLSPAPDLDALLRRRGELVRRSTELCETNRVDHVARRDVFDQIRQINGELLKMRPDALSAQQSQLSAAAEAIEQTRVARGREYFFGLYDRPTLMRLLDALPQQHDFKL